MVSQLLQAFPQIASKKFTGYKIDEALIIERLESKSIYEFDVSKNKEK